MDGMEVEWVVGVERQADPVLVEKDDFSLTHWRRDLRSVPFGTTLAGAVTGVMLGIVVLACMGIVLCLWRRRHLRRRNSMSQRGLPFYHVTKTDNPRIHVFTLTELAKATGEFSQVLILGRGSSGVVYKGLLPDGRVVAVKRSHYQASSLRDRYQGQSHGQYHSELDTLSRIHHSYLVKLLGYCLDQSEHILVFEYLPNSTLYHHLFRRGVLLSWEQRLTIALQAARALEYLHLYSDPPIIHCDFKSANILLDESWSAKVSDFGLSHAFPNRDGITHISGIAGGTPGYADPENLTLNQISKASDVYSYGVVLLEMLTGQKAVELDRSPVSLAAWAVPLIQSKLGLSILDQRLPIPENNRCLLKAAKLASRCVRPSRKDRPTMDVVAGNMQKVLHMFLNLDSTSISFN